MAFHLKRLVQRLRSDLAASEIIRGDVSHHFSLGCQRGDVDGEHRNSSAISLSNRGADCLGIARRQHYGGDSLNDEIGDLMVLPGGIKLARDQDNIKFLLT